MRSYFFTKSWDKVRRRGGRFLPEARTEKNLSPQSSRQTSGFHMNHPGMLARAPSFVSLGSPCRSR